MRRGRKQAEVVVDRVACTAHGVCAVMSDGAVQLDEFGYPIPSRLAMTPQAARELAQACPARALLVGRSL